MKPTLVHSAIAPTVDVLTLLLKIALIVLSIAATFAFFGWWGLVGIGGLGMMFFGWCLVRVGDNRER